MKNIKNIKEWKLSESFEKLEKKDVTLNLEEQELTELQKQKIIQMTMQKINEQEVDKQEMTEQKINEQENDKRKIYTTEEKENGTVIPSKILKIKNDEKRTNVEKSKMTGNKTEKNKTTKNKMTKKTIKRLAASAAALFVVVVGGVSISNADFRKSVREIFELDKEEVQEWNRVIKNKDFELEVKDSAYDGNLGRISFQIKGISSAGRELLKRDEKDGNLFSRVRFEGDNIQNCGLRCMTEEEENLIKKTTKTSKEINEKTSEKANKTTSVRYYDVVFSQKESGAGACTVQIGLDGIKKMIKIPLKKTMETKKIDMRTQQDPIWQFEEMEYSSLGFIIRGKALEKQEEIGGTFTFAVRLKDGTEKKLGHGVKEEKYNFESSGGKIEKDRTFAAMYCFGKKVNWSEIEAFCFNGVWYNL